MIQLLSIAYELKSTFIFTLLFTLELYLLKAVLTFKKGTFSTSFCVSWVTHYGDHTTCIYIC